MHPYYAAGNMAIYLGDCREVLPQLPRMCSGLLLTDPPYGLDYETGLRIAQPGRNDHLMTQIAGDGADEAADLLTETLALCRPVLTPAAIVYIFSAPALLDTTLPIVRRLGEVVNILCWDKLNGTAGDLATTYAKQWEAIIFARRARSPLLGGRPRDLLRVSRGAVADYEHPNQKPISLLRSLIGRHAPATVLDPFLGSGTTLRAAKDLGRPGIGIDLEERWCEVAARRLEQEVLPLSAGDLAGVEQLSLEG